NQYFEPEQARRAVAACLEEVAMEDELGFDWIACAEHHYSPFNLAPNVTVLASALTQNVKRAKIAILGALIPLTGNPVRIAEEYAMIDNLSGGRLVAGLLRGAPYEYLVYNVNPAESRTRFEEAWDLIVRAWTDRMPFGWEGRHFHYRNVSIWPRPLQQPTPPIYVSGSSKESGEFAARKKVGLGLAFTNRPLAAERGADRLSIADLCRRDRRRGVRDGPANVRGEHPHRRSRRGEPARRHLGLLRARGYQARRALPQPRGGRAALGRGSGRARHGYLRRAESGAEADQAAS